MEANYFTILYMNESAMGLHVFPIPIPPPASLSTRSHRVLPVHQAEHLSHAPTWTGDLFHPR